MQYAFPEFGTVSRLVPEPVFWLVVAANWSRLFQAASAPSYTKAKKKSLVLVIGKDSVQCILYI